MTATKLRLHTVAWAGLLAILALQAPVGALSLPDQGSAAPAAGQATPSTKPPATNGRAGSSRDQANRPPNGPPPPRPGQTPELVDDLRFPWWRDASVKQQLALSEDTAKVIDGIFVKRDQESRPLWPKFVDEFRILDKMTREGTSDIEVYRNQVNRVDALRSMLETSRTVMIYSMIKQLRPDQFEKLKQIAARRDRDNRDRGPGGRSNGPGPSPSSPNR